MWCLSFQGNTVFMSYTKDHRPRIAIIWDVHKYRFHKLSMYIVHIKDECGTHTFVMYEVNWNGLCSFNKKILTDQSDEIKSCKLVKSIFENFEGLIK